MHLLPSRALRGAILASALLSACAGQKQLRVDHVLQFPLGTTRGACTGTENLFRPHRNATIKRSIPEAGEGCAIKVDWEGTLLDIAALQQKIAAGERVQQLKAHFSALTLVDALGDPLSTITFSELTFELELAGSVLIKKAGKGAKGELATTATVTFNEKQLASLQLHLQEHRPLRARATLIIALDETGRRALTKIGSQPLFELKFYAEAKTAAASPSSAPASAPTTGNTTRPAPAEPPQDKAVEASPQSKPAARTPTP